MYRMYYNNRYGCFVICKTNNGSDNAGGNDNSGDNSADNSDNNV